MAPLHPRVGGRGAERRYCSGQYHGRGTFASIFTPPEGLQAAAQGSGPAPPGHMQLWRAWTDPHPSSPREQRRRQATTVPRGGRQAARRRWRGGGPGSDGTPHLHHTPLQVWPRAGESFPGWNRKKRKLLLARCPELRLRPASPLSGLRETWKGRQGSGGAPSLGLSTGVVSAWRFFSPRQARRPRTRAGTPMSGFGREDEFSATLYRAGARLSATLPLGNSLSSCAFASAECCPPPRCDASAQLAAGSLSARSRHAARRRRLPPFFRQYRPVPAALLFCNVGCWCGL